MVDIYEESSPRSKRNVETNHVNVMDDSESGRDVNSKLYPPDSERTVLKLSAFGKPLHLNLSPNEGLLRKGGLKIWTVEPNATSQHGVEYVEIPEVSATRNISVSFLLH